MISITAENIKGILAHFTTEELEAEVASRNAEPNEVQKHIYYQRDASIKFDEDGVFISNQYFTVNNTIPLMKIHRFLYNSTLRTTKDCVDSHYAADNDIQWLTDSPIDASNRDGIINMLRRI